MALQRSQQGRRPEQLYFAFGSNLHLDQMSKRCPGCRYIGIGILKDYCFQINQRGFANILPSLGDRVEGLVYLLSHTDEERLDRSEGVPTAYQKRYLTVGVFPAAIAHVGRTVSELAQQFKYAELQSTQSKASRQTAGSHDWSRSSVNDKRGLWSSKIWRQKAGAPGQYSAHHKVEGHSETTNQGQAVGPGPRQDYHSNGQLTEALIYRSSTFQEYGQPRDEYIDRMNAGIIDARELGVSDQYIDDCLRRYIPFRRIPKQDCAFAEQQSPGSRIQFQKHSDPVGTDLPRERRRDSHESDILNTSFGNAEDQVGRHHHYANLGNSRKNTKVDLHDREGLTRQQSTPLRSSATRTGGKRGRQLDHNSSRDTRDRRLDSGHARGRSRGESRSPGPSVVAADGRTRQHSRCRRSESAWYPEA